MPSASASPRSPLGSIAESQAAIWERIKEAMSGRVFLLVLIFLLTYNVAGSTAAFHWVDGIEAVMGVSLLSALLMAALAISPLLDSIALSIGVIFTVPIALIGSWSQVHLHHPGAPFGLQVFNVWSAEGRDGSLTSDTTFVLFLICILMWVSAGWLSWCVLRWRKPLVGVLPGAAALATNLLNIAPGSSDQNGYTFVMMVLVIALLLWSSYMSAIAYARRMQMKLSGDARWDFWQTGLVAMAGVIVLSIFMPPMSTSDRTLDLESGMFSSWAELQENLSHPAGIIGLHGGGSGTTGFSDDVKLVGSLKRSHDVVFTYTLAGEYGGPRYFRGVDETWLTTGEWRYAAGELVPVDKNQPIEYAENYDALGVAAFTVKMVHAPLGFSSVLFYPGRLLKVDRIARGHEAPIYAPSSTGLLSIDRLDSVQPPISSGTYTVYSEYSAATVTQLEGAGTDYPDWVTPYAVLPPNGYRPPVVQARIRNLALKVTAGTKNPYDAATAIEAFLRGPTFKYSLTAPTPPSDEDRIDFFLFHSQTGYCEYFATAMGDMLRSIGIPARLVNGFGPGQFDATVNQYVVRADDAHTWVEAYFPTYGWIPFEPTADTGNAYQTIPRGQTGGGAVCLREDGCDQPNTDTLPSPPPETGPVTHAPTTAAPNNSSGGAMAFAARLFSGVAPKLIAILVALLLLAAAAAVKYLRPTTVMAVWKRTLLLAGLAGTKARPGETPLELGRRLGKSFPEVAEPVAALSNGFAVAAYAAPEAATEVRPSVMEAWTALRPLLLRRVLSRVKLARF